ncbi:MAG: hypothetical protein M3277_11945 [Actinomycetota bacterium]|nr:hypothetical protein [Actinomycetota bacterium]
MSNATWKAQLLIAHEQGPDAAPEADGYPVTLLVGVPEGRLQATEANGRKHWLRLHTGDEAAFLADIIAPTEREIRDDSIRWVIVPGRDPADKTVNWHLFLDGASAEEYEDFLKRLQEEGCQPPVRHPPG